jgi:hypothetical protein
LSGGDYAESMRHTRTIPLVLLLVGAGGIGFFSERLPDVASRAISQMSTVCSIKGNISPAGERIYHLPADAYYSSTVISPQRGERWFCTEAEATAAGWRHART